MVSCTRNTLMTNHIPQRVPEHFSRVDIGAYMRELRLHYGLSEQDVSERLHIRIKYVTAIETANFDAMPGKAYARGYVHTYAEFLGLDADQVVERCFGGEMAREVQAHSIPESSNWYKRNKTYGGVLAVLLLLGGLLYFATQGEEVAPGDVAQLSEGVESVPEEYLASMRNRLMPTAGNFACLSGERLLGCYFDHRLTQRWVARPAVPTMSPAPASAFDEIIEDDDDEDKEEVDEVVEKEVKPEPVLKTLKAKPAEKTPPKKTEPKKPTAELTPAERKKLGEDYPGYYTPPKPEPEAAQQAPAAEPEKKVAAEKKPEASPNAEAGNE